MSHDRRRWDERYAATIGHAVPADAPSAFLVAHAGLIRGRVLDVAAGSGRNALFLARNGCSVDGLDISYVGLHAARERAVAEGLALQAVQVDLETYRLPTDRYDAVINFRYLQRSLFGALHRAVKPAGLIVFETFLIDQQALGHPRNPAFFLQRGELRAAFAACEILVYEEGLFQDPHPTYYARMIARRRRREHD